MLQDLHQSSQRSQPGKHRDAGVRPYRRRQADVRRLPHASAALQTRGASDASTSCRDAVRHQGDRMHQRYHRGDRRVRHGNHRGLGRPGPVRRHDHLGRDRHRRCLRPSTACWPGSDAKASWPAMGGVRRCDCHHPAGVLRPCHRGYHQACRRSAAPCCRPDVVRGWGDRSSHPWRTGCWRRDGYRQASAWSAA